MKKKKVLNFIDIITDREIIKLEDLFTFLIPPFKNKKMNEKIESLEEWNKAQIEEIKGDDNRWYTGKEVGHEPTDKECEEHWVKNGGSDEFRKNHVKGWLESD